MDSFPTFVALWRALPRILRWSWRAFRLALPGALLCLVLWYDAQSFSVYELSDLYEEIRDLESLEDVEASTGLVPYFMGVIDLGERPRFSVVPIIRLSVPEGGGWPDEILGNVHWLSPSARDKFMSTRLLRWQVVRIRTTSSPLDNYLAQISGGGSYSRIVLLVDERGSVVGNSFMKAGDQ